MKRLILSMICLLSIISLQAKKALAPTETAPLIQHLIEVNQEWTHQHFSDPDVLNKAARFASDKDRIQLHLRLVEAELRHRNQAPKRIALLDVLQQYWEAKEFPQNRYHANRQPYFIDHRGVACAVGHLIIQSGHEKLAQSVHEAINYAYIREIPGEALPNWAAHYGFTLDELAWIQPGYAPDVLWRSLGNGSDSTITATYADESNQLLYVAGDFQSVGGVAAAQVAVWDGNQYQSLGSGLNGMIKDLILYENDLYAGGLFAGPEGYNLAKWNGNDWSYEQIGDGGVVHSLAIWSNQLVAAGQLDLNGFGGPTAVQVFTLYNDAWSTFQLSDFNGPIYDVAVYEDELVVAGAFTEIDHAAIPYVAKLSGAAWVGLNLDDSINAPVHKLLVDGNTLYAGGDVHDASFQPTFGLAKYENGNWNRLLNTQFHQTLDSAVTASVMDMQLYNNQLIVSGTFGYMSQFVVGDLGPYLARFQNGYLEAIAAPNAPVYVLDAYDDQLISGGAFTHNDTHPFSSSPTNFIMASNLWTTGLPKTPGAVSVRVEPHPLRSQSLIRFTLPQGVGVNPQLKIMTVHGQQVNCPYEVRPDGIRLQRASLASGYYLFEIRTESHIIAREKLVVE